MADHSVLPGRVFDDPNKTRFHVPQTLGYRNGVPVQTLVVQGIGQEPLDAQTVQYLDKWDSNLFYGECRRAPKVNTVHPKYEIYENKALAFRAFCVEPVKGLMEDEPRIRHVLLFYHLEDDTISIMEPPVSNSGCVQGKVLKRHRVPKAGDEDAPFWHWTDLNVGGRVWLYGRTYQLASCDAFTREFLESHGIAVAAEIEVPPDPYTRQQTRAMQQQMEALEAHSPSANLYQGLDKLGRFLAFDRQVLRFFAVWQDPFDPQKEKRYFKVLFYLADGTMEVQPEYKLNDGHYKYPNLLARQLLPRGGLLPADLPSFREMDCYIAEDLQVGSEIEVLGRRLLLFDCDGFTRDYYAARIGIVQPPGVSTESPAPPPTVHKLPPHNGFGSPEDSLRSCLHLVPRRPCPSHPGPDDRPLRYLMRLDSERPYDLARRFVLSYQTRFGYCTITELKGRNSGREGGRFFGPRLIEKPNNDPTLPQPEYYGPSDFAIGSEVVAASCHFIVVGADLYVYKYVSERRGVFQEELIQNLADHMHKEGLLKEENN
ncbi:EF-hand domain-containing protein 1-like [Neocloeon triangulifer]|uniref:EF-hand domain-containing protein 1-like n=1 Tax=Neocloeon triangulifer TaxID=2078957 RepID=UPI00286EFB71|nr:EF-hand domain-containing protein 1-like [Neocloeon triangulifer]